MQLAVPGDITALQAELAALFPRRLVLLGGSYLYQEATEHSDIDFYIIVPLSVLFWRKKIYQKINVLKKKFSNLNFSVMFVPNILFYLGGYYIYGQDLKKEIHCSTINKKQLFRTCLKLAWWHFFQAAACPDLAKKQKHLYKAAQQTATALFIIEDERLARNQALFSRRSLLASWQARGAPKDEFSYSLLKNIAIEKTLFKYSSPSVIQLNF